MTVLINFQNYFPPRSLSHKESFQHSSVVNIFHRYSFRPLLRNDDDYEDDDDDDDVDNDDNDSLFGWIFMLKLVVICQRVSNFTPSTRQ